MNDKEVKEQEPVAHCEGGPEFCSVCHKELNPSPAIYPEEAYEMGLEEIAYYTSPPAQRKPLTDEEFLELILRTGTQELVGVAAFVGSSIQMRGKIGLLRSAKIIKEFVEAAHGIKENT